VKSIDVTQQKANTKISTSPNFLKSQQSQIDENRRLFKNLGKKPEIASLFKRMPQGLALHKILCDKNGTPVDFVTLEVNKAYERILGLKKEKIVFQKTAKDYPLTILSPKSWLEIYSEVASTGKPKLFEACSKTKDNYYQVYVYSMKSGYFVSMFLNITARKKAEEELRSTEKRYRRLYETTQDGIMARDLKGKMIDCNPAYAKMLGYSKKELRNLSIQGLLPEKWHEQREKVVNKIVQTGHSIVFEREYRRKDGSVFPASVRSWRLTDGKGKVIGVWSIVRDITEQKEHQKNLEKNTNILQRIIDERTKQLKNSERLAAIGQTAGMVGHDLRNPLQTITGELYLAKAEVNSLEAGTAKANLQDSLRIIEEQANYMDKIVSDLQAFVQPIKIDKVPFSLKELVTAVIESITIPPNIKVKTRIPRGFPQIKADFQLLKRVLINLVTNSVQAMPEGGKITLTAKVDSEGHVLISVKDTGIGIPEEIKPQIFTPLFTTKPRGQGFGLAVCKRVIEAHGGTISFESKKSKGTKFTIQFTVS